MLLLVWSTYGGGTMWIDVACRRYFMQYNDHGLVGTTGSIAMICVVDLCEIWVYLSICELMLKYVLFLYMLGNHVDYDYVLICVVIGLMCGCPYSTIWVYNRYIDDDSA